MKFANRQQELSRLRRLAQASKSALGVIWGRRRVGKTRLLIEWIEENQGLYYVADESAAPIQRKFMALALEAALPGFSDVEYPDWQSLLTRLGKDALARNWRGPLVIDEVPYLFAKTPELSSIFQKFIDHDAKKCGLIIVLSGSSQRMMQGTILDPSAPLYGRADEIIKLKPLLAGYTKDLSLNTAKEMLEFYAVFGGIPKYWELAENIPGTLGHKTEQLVLDPMGPLHEEPERLLKAESPSAIHLKPILDAIGLGAHRLSEVASRLGVPATNLSKATEQLIQLDLIEREVPYGSTVKNSKRTLYKIKDPFLRFWFQVVAPRRSLLSHVSAKSRIECFEEHLPRLAALLWEELCREAIPRLSSSWGKLYEPAGRFWHGKGPEWDILSQSHDQKHFLIGEAKWSSKAATPSWVQQQLEELMTKGIPPVQRQEKALIEYALFCPEFPQNFKAPQNVRLISVQEVLKALV